MDRFFSLDLPPSRFLMHVLVISLAGLVPVLLVYVLTTPGFAALLWTSAPARGLVLRQLLVNGLPVVFAINYGTCVVYALHQRASVRQPVRLVATDLALRLSGFVLLHALIFMLAAKWLGSFGGSVSTALQVVGPTLARAPFFENLSGVYLYATLLSALPVHATAIDDWLHQRGNPTALPTRAVAIGGAILIFALFAGLLGLVGTWMTG